MQQTTNTIVMIRPINFRMNEQTAVKEFDAYVEKLQEIGVNVVVIEDTKEFDTPDAIFPNNWISFHENGTVALYPMFAENRRLERREDVLDIIEERGFVIENVVDYTSAEEVDVFLEGTGSLLLDRVHRKAYCALSPRADEELFIEPYECNDVFSRNICCYLFSFY